MKWFGRSHSANIRKKRTPSKRKLCCCVRILPLATLARGYNIVVGTSGCDEKQQVVMYIFLSKMQNKHISTRFAFRGENFLVTLRLISVWGGVGGRVKRWKGFYKVKKWKGEKVKRWLRPLNLSAKRQVRQPTYIQPYKPTWQLINLTTHSLTNSFVNNLNKNK